MSFPAGQIQAAGTTGKSNTGQHPCLADPVLHRSLLQCHYSGVAPSTRQTYQSGLNAFNKFCHVFGIPPFPASSLTLEYFCVHVSQHVSYKTLKVYFSGICLARDRLTPQKVFHYTWYAEGSIANRVITVGPDYPSQSTFYET